MTCGSLRYDHLNARGAAFTRNYYPGYADAWRATFGDNAYDVEDSWDSYQRIAAVLTLALQGKPDRGAASPPAPASRWWQFWK